MNWPEVIIRTPNPDNNCGYTEVKWIGISASEAGEFERLRFEKPAFKAIIQNLKSDLSESTASNSSLEKSAKAEGQEFEIMEKKLHLIEVALEKERTIHKTTSDYNLQLEQKNERYLSALKILRDKPVEVTCNFPKYPETKTTWTPFVQGHGTVKEITQWAIGEEDND